jgi:hypothetical protein
MGQHNCLANAVLPKLVHSRIFHVIWRTFHSVLLLTQHNASPPCLCSIAAVPA